jgi:hypothetical protein
MRAQSLEEELIIPAGIVEEPVPGELPGMI